MNPPLINGLRLRAVMGRKLWRVPEPHYNVGWHMRHVNDRSSVIVSAAPLPPDDIDWVHASISHRQHMPTYEELALLHTAAFGDGYAYQVFAPPSAHINIHPYALHLWGRLDGAPGLPDFGEWGTI